jgi:hypothetical protein
MRPWVQLFVFSLALGPWTGTAGTANGSIVASSEESETSIVLRFSNKRIVSCGEPRESVAGRKLTRRVDSQWASSTATLNFEPLADPRRRVLRSDRRNPFSVELHQKSQPTEQQLAIAKGPWRVTWKEATRSIRADVEDVAVSIVATSTIGKCRSGNWRCSLDTRATERKLEVRSGTGK